MARAFLNCPCRSEDDSILDVAPDYLSKGASKNAALPGAVALGHRHPDGVGADEVLPGLCKSVCRHWHA